MMRKVGVVVLLLGFMVCAVGCGTVKGVGYGFARVVQGAADGATKDSKNLWQKVMSADGWFRRNFW